MVANTGHTGLPGQTGVTGVNGVSGNQGESGLSGAPGAMGQTGVTGLSGQVGDPGAVGQTGAGGAVGAGATPVLEAVGPQGVVGAPGTQGPTGVTGVGATGVVGGTGLNGASGIVGPTGPAGTNVNATTASFYQWSVACTLTATWMCTAGPVQLIYTHNYTSIFGYNATYTPVSMMGYLTITRLNNANTPLFIRVSGATSVPVGGINTILCYGKLVYTSIQTGTPGPRVTCNLADLGSLTFTVVNPALPPQIGNSVVFAYYATFVQESS